MEELYSQGRLQRSEKCSSVCRDSTLSRISDRSAVTAYGGDGILLWKHLSYQRKRV